MCSVCHARGRWPSRLLCLDAIVILAGSIAFPATTPNFWKCRQMRSAVTHLFTFSADKVTLTFKVKCLQEQLLFCTVFSCRLPDLSLCPSVCLSVRLCLCALLPDSQTLVVVTFYFKAITGDKCVPLER